LDRFNTEQTKISRYVAAAIIWQPFTFSGWTRSNSPAQARLNLQEPARYQGESFFHSLRENCLALVVGPKNRSIN
jgi:hypothetical protein